MESFNGRRIAKHGILRRVVPAGLIGHCKPSDIAVSKAAREIRFRERRCPVDWRFNWFVGDILVRKSVSGRRIDCPCCFEYTSFCQQLPLRFARGKHESGNAEPRKIGNPFLPVEPIIIAADEAIDKNKVLRPDRGSYRSFRKLGPISSVVDGHCRGLRSLAGILTPHKKAKRRAESAPPEESGVPILIKLQFSL